MQYRQLGRSGLAVSVVGLGGNNFGMRIDLAATRAVVDAALECGINFIDSAELYGGGESERMLGEVLKGRRQHVVVATKFGRGGMRMPGMPAGLVSPEAHGSRQYVRHAVEDSLKRLQTDYIDLYYLHFPDPRTPMEETLEALTELVREGKVRYIGTCNHSAWQLVEADWIARTHNLARFIATQNSY
ncbi:MAG: aldo/keto reductase, partial [Chloroflexota bacterium]